MVEFRGREYKNGKIYDFVDEVDETDGRFIRRISEIEITDQLTEQERLVKLKELETRLTSLEEK